MADASRPRRRPPPLLALGVVVFVAGSLADVGYHVASAQPLVESFLGADGEPAHLAIFAGMALVVLGLVEAGVRAGRQPPVRRAPSDEEVRVAQVVPPVVAARPGRLSSRGDKRRRA